MKISLYSQQIYLFYPADLQPILSLRRIIDVSLHYTIGRTITNTKQPGHTITRTQFQTHIYKPTIRVTQINI